MLVNRVIIENFCDRNVKIDVEIKSPITILIGENGTGKHCFMNYIRNHYPNYFNFLGKPDEGVLSKRNMLSLSRDLLLSDCPEYGVHPRRLQTEVVDVFGFCVKNGCQIFCKTYSPYLLDYFEPEQVLLFVKKDGIRRVLPLDQCGIEDWIGEFSLGEIYYNMGDEELANRYDKLQSEKKEKK